MTSKMGESSGPQGGFKCCSMCMRHCFEKHADFGRQETEELFSAPSFSSLMQASHITGDKLLRIPVLFFERQTYNIGEKLHFRGPGGFEFDCSVRRHRNGYVLCADFTQFLVHHAVEAGDLLIFYLIAKDHFLIKVHSKFGVEKVPGLNNPSTAEGVDDGSDEETLDRVLNLRRKQLGKEPAVSSGEETKGRSCSNMPEPSLDNAAGMANRTEELGASRYQNSGRTQRLPDTSRRAESKEERQEVLSSFLSGVDGKKESARCQMNAANALMQKLKNPSQLVFMKNSHVVNNKTVYLSKLPLPDESDLLTLVDEAGEQYTVKWAVPSDGRSRLSSGWDQFAYDHRIAVDDACLFEASGSHLIKVYIFRLVDFINTGNQHQEQDHRDDLQPSALEQSISEERDSLRGQQSDTASAGLS